MKIDVARQPLGLILLTSMAAVFLTVIRSAGISSGPELTAGPDLSPSASLLEGIFRNGWLRYTVVTLILMVNAFMLTRIMVIYKANFGRSFLCAAIYIMAAVGIMAPYGSVTASLASLLLVISTDQAVSAFRRNYRFEAVFKSSFALGFIPLLYSPAIALWLIIPVILALYQRTVREIVAAAAGLLLPLFVCSAGWWAAGYSWTYLVESFTAGLSPALNPGFRFGTDGSYMPLLLAGLYVVITIASVIILIINYNKYPNRVRKVYVHMTALLLCCVPMYFIFPANPAILISLSAIPGSVIATHFFIKINRWIGMGVYLILIFLFIASNI